MIECSKHWNEAALSTIRGPGTFKYLWPINSSSPEQAVTGGEDDATAVFNYDWTGDNIASTENGRWLLDGTKHSMYIDNIVKEENLNYPRLNHIIISCDYSHQSSIFEGFPDDYSGDTLTTMEDINTGVQYQAYPFPEGEMTLSIETQSIKWSDLDKSGQVIYTEAPRADKVTVFWDTAGYTYPKAGLISVTIRRDAETVYLEERYFVNSEKSLSNTVELEPDSLVVAINIVVYGWSTPGTRARVSEIIFGDYISDMSEEVSLTSVEVTKEISLISNTAPSYSCVLKFDNTNKFFDPLGKKGITSHIKAGTPVYSYWTLESVDGSIDTTQPESWRVVGWECSSDSTEATLTLGTMWDYAQVDYVPSIEPCGYVSLKDWVEDAASASYNNDVIDFPRHAVQSTDHPENFTNYTKGYASVGSSALAIQHLCQLTDMVPSVSKYASCLYLKPIRDTGLHITEEHILNSPKIYDDSVANLITVDMATIIAITGSSLSKLRLHYSIDKSYESSTYIFEFGEYSQVKGSSVIGIANSVWAANVGGYLDQSFGRKAAVTITRVDSDESEFWLSFDKASYERKDSRTFQCKSKSIGDKQDLSIYNPFASDNNLVTKLVRFIDSIVKYNKLIEFTYLGDSSIEPGDIITVTSEYGTCTVIVYKTQLSFNGGFEGTINGRIIGDIYDY